MIILPTPEIIAKAKSLYYYVEHLIDPSDSEANDIMESWYKITEKYDFGDLIFEENGHFGIKDVEGNILVPAQYKGFEEMHDLFYKHDYPVSAINDEGKAALITTDGTNTPLCDFIYNHIFLCIENDKYYITQQNNKSGLITLRGELLLPCEYDRIEDCTNGIFLLRKGHKYGIFCEYGRGFTIPCIYDDIDNSYEIVYVRKGNDHGYLDEKGNFILEQDVPEPQNQPNLLRFTKLIGPCY